jgi:hypothetical protein
MMPLILALSLLYPADAWIARVVHEGRMTREVAVSCIYWDRRLGGRMPWE